jgi:hypothetical protein
MILMYYSLKGVKRFSGDIETMIGHEPGIYWKVCWMCIAPVFLLVNIMQFRKESFI